MLIGPSVRLASVAAAVASAFVTLVSGAATTRAAAGELTVMTRSLSFGTDFGLELENGD